MTAPPTSPDTTPTAPQPERRSVFTPSRKLGRRLRGRPQLYTAYRQDQALVNTPAKRAALIALIVAGMALPMLLEDDVLGILARGLALAVGAIGLNLVTGYAGQVSLGHAFFVGIGAYTAAFLGGDPDGRNPALGLDMWIWLPAAGLVPAFFGLVVSPLASRLRGLYLAIVTLGLVFLGEHVFREWRTMTGGVGIGRQGAQMRLGGERFDVGGELFGIMLTRPQRVFWVAFIILVVMAILARNLARSDVGRAFQAVRDRDVAARTIGVNLAKMKALAFTASSFYAGIAGGLFFAVTGFIEPTRFNLLLSVEFVAMVLIGGVATISGAIAGAMFIALLPRFTRELPELVPFISTSPTGGLLNTAQVEVIFYGLLIIGFLVFEPRGLFGIWLRIRNYWKGWPFSY